MDSLLARLLRVGELEQLGERTVGVVYPHQGGLYGLLQLQVPVHKHHGGLCGVEVVLILRIRQERERTRGGLLNLREFAHGGLRIPLYRTA